MAHLAWLLFKCFSGEVGALEEESPFVAPAFCLKMALTPLFFKKKQTLLKKKKFGQAHPQKLLQESRNHDKQTLSWKPLKV